MFARDAAAGLRISESPPRSGADKADIIAWQYCNDAAHCLPPSKPVSPDRSAAGRQKVARVAIRTLRGGTIGAVQPAWAKRRILAAFRCVMTTADISSTAPSADAVQFLGQEAAYWRLRIKGAALLVLTLGIYRFWFATDVRRYLWSHTEIGGETLEYTGLATELLGGFLIAIAIVAPLYTAIASTALALETAEAATATIAFLVLVLLGQFALYRARRYRLTRTVFRGVRFDQHGSAWRYACYALLWWTLVMVTLGLAYPWAQATLQRYKMRHTSYGDLPGAFDGSGAALFVRGLPVWLLVVGPILVAFLALGAMVDWDAMNGMMAQGENNPLAVLVGGVGSKAFTVVGAAIGASIAATLLLYPVFQAMLWRWWISGLRFGTVSVTSHLRTAQVYRVYLRFVLYTLLFMVLVTATATLAMYISGAIVGPHRDSALAELAPSAITLGLYVVIALGVSTIYQVVVTFAMWRLGAQSAVLSGADILDSVRASGAPSSALGEGLADALGVGGI